MKFEHSIIPVVAEFFFLGDLFLWFFLGFGRSKIFLKDFVAEFLLRFSFWDFLFVDFRLMEFDGLVEVAVDVETHDEIFQIIGGYIFLHFIFLLGGI